ncbi:MAG: hypothetical protein Q8Q06_04560 [bacterium]|nr:hypothetical protein [bacterium]
MPKETMQPKVVDLRKKTTVKMVVLSEDKSKIALVYENDKEFKDGSDFQDVIEEKTGWFEANGVVGVSSSNGKGKNNISPANVPGNQGKSKGHNSKKRSAWGFPGGKVGDLDMTKRLIQNFLPVEIYKGQSNEKAIMNFQKDAPREKSSILMDELFYGAIKEGIEELGVLVFPERNLLMDKTNSSHIFVLVYAPVARGEVSVKRTLETETARWFDLDGLPLNMYPSHIERLDRVANALGIDPRLIRQTSAKVFP